MSDVGHVIRKQPSGNFSLTLDDFGVLQPINVYNEPYLVAHTIFEGMFVYCSSDHFIFVLYSVI